jgi:hypothetical protein
MSRRTQTPSTMQSEKKGKKIKIKKRTNNPLFNFKEKKYLLQIARGNTYINSEEEI